MKPAKSGTGQQLSSNHANEKNYHSFNPINQMKWNHRMIMNLATVKPIGKSIVIELR